MRAQDLEPFQNPETDGAKRLPDVQQTGKHETLQGGGNARRGRSPDAPGRTVKVEQADSVADPPRKCA